MAAQIQVASSSSDYEAFGALMREYVGWCQARYGHHQWFVDAAFSHQSLEDELTLLSTSYGPPNGKTLLARQDGEVSGCCAYRNLSDGICEMKRLFVPPRFHGSGIGRRLCEAIIATARDDDFKLMRLDTATLLTEAIKLYRSAGFEDCAPYNDYPSELMPYLVFMERRL